MAARGVAVSRRESRAARYREIDTLGAVLHTVQRVYVGIAAAARGPKQREIRLSKIIAEQVRFRSDLCLRENRGALLSTAG